MRSVICENMMMTLYKGMLLIGLRHDDDAAQRMLLIGLKQDNDAVQRNVIDWFKTR